MTTSPTALVIGSGFGGLAAALRLRAKGYEVTIVERQPDLGGRARVFRRNGFVYDAGPTVVTAPFLLDELFALFNRNSEDYLKIVPVEPWYRFRFNDGETFDYGGTIEGTLNEIERLSPEDRDGYLNLVQESRQIFDKGFSELAHIPFHRWTTMLRQVPALLKLRSYRSVYQMVSAHLKDERLRQAFSIQPLLVGGNPFTTTSIYSLIHYLERKWGVHFAMGGTGAIVAGFEKLLREEGVQIKTNATVTKIITQQRRVTGVELDNSEKPLLADLVVCRSGALTLAEITVCGKASVLIPYPHAAGDHQTKNAQTLVNAGASRILFEKYLKINDLFDLIISLINNDNEISKMSKASKLLGQPKATNLIVDQIFSLIS